jgi:hypothetical protein
VAIIHVEPVSHGDRFSIEVNRAISTTLYGPGICGIGEMIRGAVPPGPIFDTSDFSPESYSH